MTQNSTIIDSSLENNAITPQQTFKQAVFHAFLDCLILAGTWFGLMVLATMIWVGYQTIASGQAISPTARPSMMAGLLISMPPLYLGMALIWFFRGRRIKLPAIIQAKTHLILLSLAAGIVIFMMNMLVAWWIQKAGIKMNPTNQAIIQDALIKWPFITAFLAVMVAPFFEELFFRKQLFARFANAGHTRLGILISSCLFALMHEPLPTQGILIWLFMLALYASMGAAFAWLYHKTGQLWTAMLAHAINNLFGVTLMHISLLYS